MAPSPATPAGASHALGAAARAAVPPAELAGACAELAACGALSRVALAAGLRSAGPPSLPPPGLVGLAAALARSAGDGAALALLRDLCPAPEDACAAIAAACSARDTTRELLAGFDGGDGGGAPALAPPAVRVLRAVLGAALAPAPPPAGVAWGGALADERAADARRFAERVAARLAEAAAHDAALNECLWRAADGAAAAVGRDAVAAWAARQLRALLEAAPPPGPRTAPGDDDDDGCDAWAALALQQSSWARCVMPHALRWLRLAPLLALLRGSVSGAAASAQGLLRLADALEGLRACGPRADAAVRGMLAASLADGLRDGQPAALLPPLLLAQRALSGDEYGAALAAAAAGLPTDAAGASAGWACLLDALSLTLPGAELGLVQAHLQLLKQLGHAAASAGLLRQRIAATLDLLQDAAQGLRRQAAAQPGAQEPHARLSAGFQNLLRQFESAAAPVNGRRRLTQPAAAQWRMQRGHVAAFADAISLNPPESAHEARLRWEYLQALQDIALLPLGQFEKFFGTCASCGIDAAAITDPAASARGAAAEGPQQTLRRLLAQLPGVVGSQQALATQSLLRGIGQQVEAALAELAAERAAKRPRATAAGSGDGGGAGGGGGGGGDAASAAVAELVGALLGAYAAALDEPRGGRGLEWRLGFLRLLQGAAALHGALLTHLAAGMCGALPGCTTKHAAAHGRLAALMAASRPGQLLALLGRLRLGDSSHAACCAAAFVVGFAAQVQQLGRWCGGPCGPFGGTAAASGAAAGAPELVGYVPWQLVGLLRGLAARLAGHAAAADGGSAPDADAVAVAQQCHRVCTSTLAGSQVLLWAREQARA
ncbi:hypothetical protein HT031_004763 [Scenedesmus sp. PABB004]|nr:hypothetical protein HT031_004763 [Scenedesmus sp. PABB004]